MPVAERSSTWTRGAAVWMIGLGAAGAWCSMSSSVHAAGKSKKQIRDECIAASEEGQLLSSKGQLEAAREKLALCSDKSCPGAVRKDCEAGLEALERATPTVVFAAKDAAGRDLTEVSVSIDGKPRLDSLDGKAIALDPGKHSVRFETAGKPALEKTLLIREGEKARIVMVTLADAKPKPKQGPEPARGSRELSTGAWVVGGIGAAALATAGVVGFVALQKRSSLKDECGDAGTCTQDEVDSVYRLYNVSYVAAGLGGALLLTSGVLYFTSSPKSPPEKQAWSLHPTPGGAVVKGRF